MSRNTKWTLLILPGVLYIVAMIWGTISQGPEFMGKPVPWISEAFAGWVFGVMAILNVIGMWLNGRNLFYYGERMNYQEIAYRRGVFLIFFGGTAGYLARVLAQNASISMGTPFVMIGTGMIIYALVKPPVRWRAEDELIKKLQNELDSYHAQDPTHREAC